MICHFCAMYQQPETHDIRYIDGTVEMGLMDISPEKYRELKEYICAEHADRLIILSLTVLKG